VSIMKDISFIVWFLVLTGYFGHAQTHSDGAKYDTRAFPQQSFLVDTHMVYVPAGEWQGTPAIAYDGVNYLIVWEDERYGTTDIYGARIASNAASDKTCTTAMPM